MALLGTTIKETIAAFKSGGETKGGIYGASSNRKSAKTLTKKEVWARFTISVILIGVAVWLLNKDIKSQSAMTIIGFVAGYWLK